LALQICGAHLLEAQQVAFLQEAAMGRVDLLLLGLNLVADGGDRLPAGGVG
jgi:hypothetical protein